MRLRSLLLAAALVAMVFSGPALAQRQGGGRGPGGFGGFGGFGGGFGRGGGGVSGLLQMEEVRKEIELLDDQWAQVQKINEEARNAAQPGGQGFDREAFQNLSQEEREKQFLAMREQFEKRAKETDAKVKEVLLPHQTERLEQLALQRQGVRALGTAEVAAKLTLSDEQKKKIESIQAAQAEKMRAAFQNFGQNQQGARPNFDELRAENEKVEGEILAVLTPEQKKQFEELKGKPFEFPQRQFGGPGGPGGGQGRRPATENQ